MGSAGGSGGSAGGNTLVSIGLSAASTMMKAEGASDSYQYQADRLERAAEYGEVKGKQTSAQMTRSLNTTLGNIEAVRAAVHADPNSPTGAAFYDNQQQIGSDQIATAVGNIAADTAQKKSDAAYYRASASNALLTGGIDTALGIVKGLSGMSMPGGGG